MELQIISQTENASRFAWLAAFRIRVAAMRYPTFCENTLA